VYARGSWCRSILAYGLLDDIVPSRASPCKLLREFVLYTAAKPHAIVAERGVDLDERRAGIGKREGVCPR